MANNKKFDIQKTLTILGLFLFVIGVGSLVTDKFGLTDIGLLGSGTSASVVGSGVQGTGNGNVYVDATTKPTTTSFYLNVYNPLNLSSSENYDVTAYVLDSTGASKVATITDTTSPSATTLNYNTDYLVKVIGTDGAAGDSSWVSGATGIGCDVSIVDGNMVVKTTSATCNINANIGKHATMQVKAFDVNANGWMYVTTTAVAGAYSTTGIHFTSATDNATNTTASNGMDIKFTLQAVQSYTDYNDRGIIVLLTAPVSSWDTPAMKINGQALQDVKGNGAVLTPDEIKAYSSYDYVYVIPQNVIIQGSAKTAVLEYIQSLQTGVTSYSGAVHIDFAPRTQYLATNGLTVKSGAVTDAGSPANIYTQYTMDVYTQ